jgi:hypothetical protein
MPSRAGLDATIALWGKVELEPLDSDSMKIVAEGKSPKKGFLIDFIGDFTRSAKEGLPVYRIGGGAGLIWAASYDRDGRGTLRFVAVDASRISPNTQVQNPNSADVPQNSSQSQLQGRAELTEDERAKLNAEVSRIQAEGAAAMVDAENARIEAENARADAERSKTDAARIITEERAKVDAALTRLAEERANANSSTPSMQTLAYGAIVGLGALLALVAFLLGKLNRTVQTNDIKAGSPSVVQSQTERSTPQAPPLVPQTPPSTKPVISFAELDTKSPAPPKCQRCQSDITPGAKFCSNCGVSVTTGDLKS